MDTTEVKIAQEYKKMVKYLQSEVGKSGVVRSVDTDTLKAQVQLTIHDHEQTVDALLNATPGNDMGIVIYPKLDSDVVVCDIDGDGIYTIIQYGKIDKVVVKIGGTEELEIIEGNIVINGGENGGLVKVNELVDKINALEDKVNDVIDKWNGFCTDYVAGSPATTGLPATLATEVLTTLTNTAVSDIENENVKH